MGQRSTDNPPLRRGDLVALRTSREILETLDATGSLEGLPFMPEMLAYFGRRFSVAARVERACDTIEKSGARRMRGAVMLEDFRCDGSGHGGCQAGCRIYWKEAWLRRVEPRGGEPATTPDEAYEELRELAGRNTRPGTPPPEAADVYRCQATEFLRATEPLEYWDARSFLREVACGNVSLFTFVRVVAGVLANEPRRRWLGHKPFNKPVPTPSVAPPLGIALGSRVRVRPKDEIAATLDENSRLRGLWFDREMVPYCGKTATVKAKVERFINEKTGEMVELKSDCYILEGVVCRGQISDGRWFCCREIYPWWREAWLEDDEKGMLTSAPSRGVHTSPMNDSGLSGAQHGDRSDLSLG